MKQPWQDVRLDDADLSSPEGIRAVLEEFNAHCRRAFEVLMDEIRKPENITVDTDNGAMDLQEAIRRCTLPVGTCIPLYTTWARALSYQQYGWEIAHSGNPLTPPLTPKQGSSDLQRLPRGVAWGQDAWDSSKAARQAGTASTHNHGTVEVLEDPAGSLVEVSGYAQVSVYPPVCDLIWICRVR